MTANTQESKDKAFANRVLKVNHAGENGAIHIYAGQILLARVTAPSLVKELKKFKTHEERHRAIFNAEPQSRHMPRCRSYWLCAAGGLMLGIITGLFGQRAIAATTVAVERVVLSHLKKQLTMLLGRDEAAVAAIREIVDEEQRHHDVSASHLNAGQFWPRLLTPIVSASTESVIWLGMRL